MTAGATGDVDPQPDAVLIVVNQKFADRLHQAAAGAFVPENLAAAAVIMRLTGRYCELQRLSVHIALHQDLAAVGICRDDGDESAVIEFWCEVVAFLYLLDRAAGLKSDGRGRHSGSLNEKSGGREEYRATLPAAMLI